MEARSERRRIAATLALAVVVAIVSHGCQETAATPGGAQACTLGEEAPCGNAGDCTATCLPDLSAYGPCICGDAGADADAHVTDGGKQDAP